MGVECDQVMAELAPFMGPEIVPSTQYRVVRSRLAMPRSCTRMEAARLLTIAGKKLHTEVAEQRPQWRFAVVFDFAPYHRGAPPASVVINGTVVALKERILTAFQDVVVGTLWLSRASDRNGACIQHVDVDILTGITSLEAPLSATLSSRQRRSWASSSSSMPPFSKNLPTC